MAINGTLYTVGGVTTGAGTSLHAAVDAHLSANWTVGALQTEKAGTSDEYTFFVCQHTTTGVCILWLINEGSSADLAANLDDASSRAPVSFAGYGYTTTNTIGVMADTGNGASNFYDAAYTDGNTPASAAFFAGTQPTEMHLFPEIGGAHADGDLAIFEDVSSSYGALFFVTRNTATAGYTKTSHAVLIGEILDASGAPVDDVVCGQTLVSESDAGGNDLTTARVSLNTGEAAPVGYTNTPLNGNWDVLDDINPTSSDPDPVDAAYHAQTWPVNKQIIEGPFIGHHRRTYLLYAYGGSGQTIKAQVTDVDTSDEYIMAMDGVYVGWDSTNIPTF